MPLWPNPCFLYSSSLGLLLNSLDVQCSLLLWAPTCVPLCLECMSSLPIPRLTPIRFQPNHPFPNESLPSLVSPARSNSPDLCSGPLSFAALTKLAITLTCDGVINASSHYPVSFPIPSTRKTKVHYFSCEQITQVKNTYLVIWNNG